MKCISSASDKQMKENPAAYPANELYSFWLELSSASSWTEETEGILRESCSSGIAFEILIQIN